MLIAMALLGPLLHMGKTYTKNETRKCLFRNLDSSEYQNYKINKTLSIVLKIYQYIDASCYNCSNRQEEFLSKIFNSHHINIDYFSKYHYNAESSSRLISTSLKHFKYLI